MRSAQKAMVETAMIAPVRLKSFCVTPCWIRSPMTTSTMSSNGVIWPSSRLPIRRTSTYSAKKMTVARRTMSIRAAP